MTRVAKRLGVIGAGPKALAIAAKAATLRRLHLADITVVIFEQTDVAANWHGREGFTDGEQELGTSPEKDVGFPYGSLFGDEVNREMLARYSWHRYKSARGAYSSWVDRGRRHPLHKEWGSYLRWVFEQLRPDVDYKFVRARVARIEPSGGSLEIVVEDGAAEARHLVDGIVLTGPGLPDTGEWDQTGGLSVVFDGKSYWQNIARFSELQSGKVAVIGGGETGATVAISLLKETKADVQIDLISRRGTIYSRGESYRENRLFSEPATWVGLDEKLRLEFLQRTDRGVFSPAASAKIDQSPRVNTLLLEIKSFGGDGESAHLQYVDKASPTGDLRARYERIVMALPFNPAAPLLSMLPERFRPRLKPEGDVKNLTMMRGIDWYLRLDLADDAADAGRRLNIHVPMLAGLRQGPGFPNLSCLGLLSDRILSTYTDTEDAETKPG